LKEKGIAPRKVDVDVRKLATWCQMRGRALDADSRATYVSENMQLLGKQIMRRKLRRRRG
jgi:hypothetical protein